MHSSLTDIHRVPTGARTEMGIPRVAFHPEAAHLRHAAIYLSILGWSVSLDAVSSECLHLVLSSFAVSSRASPLLEAARAAYPSSDSPS